MTIKNEVYLASQCQRKIKHRDNEKIKNIHKGIIEFAIGLGVSEENALEIYKKSVSLFQASRPVSGRIVEDTVKEMLENICPGKFKPQCPIPGWKGFKLDGFISAPNRDWFFSTVKNPQERKDHTFNGEYSKVKEYYDEQKRAFTFVVIVDCLKKGQKGEQNFRSKLNPNIRLVIIQVTNDLRNLITDVRKSSEEQKLEQETNNISGRKRQRISDG